MPRRFRDAGQSTFTFNDTFLVRCPRCQRRAEVVPLPNAPEPKTPYFGLFAPRRCVCAHCGYVKEWRGNGFSVSRTARDWYFKYPLWLQTPCCGQVLWANNEAHLRLLEEYVGADLRERTPERRNSHSQTSTNKLPKWMKSGLHRDEVLRGLARLRALLGE